TDWFSVQTKTGAVTTNELLAEQIAKGNISALLSDTPPKKPVKPEELEKYISNFLGNIVGKLQESEKGAWLYRIMNLAINIAILPMILGNVAGIIAEQKYLQPARKTHRPTLLSGMEYIHNQ
ncbi:unnamed protein product, partial [marine sediment metagenome]